MIIYVVLHGTLLGNGWLLADNGELYLALGYSGKSKCGYCVYANKSPVIYSFVED